MTKIRTWAEQRRAELALRKEWLDGLSQQFETQSDLARSLGMKRSSLQDIAQRCGATLPEKEGAGDQPPRTCRASLQDCAKRGLSKAETARELGVSATAITQRAKKFGIKFTYKGSTPTKKPVEKPKPMTLADYAAIENAQMRKVGVK